MSETTDAIVVDGLTKRFGGLVAVDNLSFSIRAGAITGFLGPNGAGKTTTLRMLLGLTQPTAGTATVHGKPYREHQQPGRVVGAALEASAFHPGRSGRDHLRAYAGQVAATRSRCDEVLEIVGLTDAATRRVGGYSMGMRQRLGLATAVLADPPILVLDEPANGLDPQGIVWLRSMLRSFAAEGRTVLVSSHVLGEVQSTVDDVVIIGRGRLIHSSSLEEMADLADPGTYVAGPDLAAIEQLAAAQGWASERSGAGCWLPGQSSAAVGAAALAARVELHELTPRHVDLEQVFLNLTAEQPAGAA